MAFFDRYLSPETADENFPDWYWCEHPGCASSGYRYDRGHHYGQDIPGDPGRTPLKAGRAGVVVSTGYIAGWDSTGRYLGKQVLIKYRLTLSGQRFWGHFSHLDSIAVRPGDKVAAGTTIGVMGSTGNSSGEHCHFELHTSPYRSQGMVNPYNRLQVARKAELARRR